ncbi:MAG: ATP-dependent DNA helicase srs2 [Ramalina farinacea]|uniref:DNA 3'-5' helicase n=1 Tax=Ramalina farinacea TaxID=258253 RepID=A0AA43U038_9LECA|nr:ATP-dependent DNA helicase srs2 [Ramalina farinacea]
MTQTILDGLNAAQKGAVSSEADVLQILAPPGSGKTKTLTSRVAYLLRERNYKPWNVICLTFTVKSSREMGERLAKLLDSGYEKKLILGTFHSVCRRYLVSYGHLIGLSKDFGIADSNDSLAIIKRIVKRHRLKVDAYKTRGRISHAKSRGKSFHDLIQEQLKAKKKDEEQEEFITAFEEYEAQLERGNLLDFDDLLLRCVTLLETHPHCVSNVEAVLIDEFQDTNLVQFDLMRLFASQHNRITTVGDPDQSIYGWRSAEVENLNRMQILHPDTLVVHLEENYRSSGAILLAAREVIEQDVSRPKKELLPTHCPGTIPVLRKLPSAEIEAAWIVSEIKRTRALTGNLLNYSDYAILLRSAALSRLIETAMGRAGMPYRMVGGHKFYDRTEIKILLDYLRVISQPSNNDAVARVLNVPTRGVGDITLKALLEEAESKQTTLWQLIRNIVQGHTIAKTKISNQAEKGLGAFTSIILSLRSKLMDTTQPVSPETMLQSVMKKLEFRLYLVKLYPEDHEARWANVEELAFQAAECNFRVSSSNNDDDLSSPIKDTLPAIDGLTQDSGNSADEALSTFLANVALASERQQEGDDDEESTSAGQVTISTIHAAKGLEWPAVFVTSVYDKCIPHSRAEDTDEERRLLYVAMTRAQALLYLSCPTKTSQREDATLSPFLSEKKVRKFLADQGPSFENDTVFEVSRIIGRKCPDRRHIIIATRDLKSTGDNLWPLDGTEAGRRKWDGNAAELSPQKVAKRQKMTGVPSVAPMGGYTTTNVGHRTTMQDASKFSFAGSATFTTASIHMHQLREQDLDEGKARRKASRPYPEPARDSSLDQRRGLDLSQSFIKKSGAPADKKIRLDGGLMTMSKVRSSRAIEDCFDRANPARTQVMSREDSPEYKKKGSLLAREDEIQPGLRRRVIKFGETGAASNRPVLLSSSPPTLPDMIQDKENSLNDSINDTTKHDDTAQDARKPRHETHSVENALKHREYIKNMLNEVHEVEPVERDDTTFVARPRPTGSRKTLGVRRALAPWSAGSKQGFSVPKSYKPNG